MVRRLHSDLPSYNLAHLKTSEITFFLSDPQLNPANRFLLFISHLDSERLTNYTTDGVGVTDAFRLVQAVGVSSPVWLIGRSASPGRTEPR
jgi:hypothetical protein